MPLCGQVVFFLLMRPYRAKTSAGNPRRRWANRAIIASASCLRIKNSWWATASHAGVLPIHPRPIVPSAFRN